MPEEEAYDRWLQEVSHELNTLITPEDVKGKFKFTINRNNQFVLLDCLYVMNELLYLHYSPKENDLKAFEQYELA